MINNPEELQRILPTMEEAAALPHQGQDLPKQEDRRQE